MRSKLFVPGSRPALFQKAWESPADAISLDLEDAVLEDQKVAARHQVAKFLGSVGQSEKTIIVRCNGPYTLHFEADAECALAYSAVSMLNIPKVESASDVNRTVTRLEAIESRLGLKHRVKLLLNIETPLGLQHASEIACANPRVAGLQLGLSDLCERMGMERYDPANVRIVMFAVRLAAAHAGVLAFDSAFPNISDVAGFRAEAQMARSMGFTGKSCIHPRQIAIANDVFCPSPVEIAGAILVLDRARSAEVRGEGAFVHEGHMIDRPAVLRAQAVLQGSRGASISKTGADHPVVLPKIR